MENITDILKEATNDLLTEDVLKQIEEAFEHAVEEKASIHVEKALTEQDDEHAEKLERLLEAIDNDHTKKLHRVVEAVTQNHTEKLHTVASKYQNVLHEEAGQFKGELVDNISDYLDVYLEEKLPAQEIAEAVKAKKAEHLVGQLRSTLGVDLALANESIATAIVDGKQQIDESVNTISQLNEHNDELTNELIKARSHILLTEKTDGLPENKTKYLFKVLSGKSEKFINENFDYTLKLFDKTEEERLEQYKQEASSEPEEMVDRVITETVDPSNDEVVPEQTQPSYMSELQKW
jgi:hypothetical protein